MNDLKFIFVHGLSGWGSYDAQYEKMPYWGMRGGDLIKKLRNAGYDCYAASVHPKTSAYDRACELYGQLTGTVTDYGPCHAEENAHARFGPDFTGRALLKEFNKDTRLVLIGHSFGGATVRMFAHLMAYGSEKEKGSGSPLFEGGMADNIFAVVTIAAPHNGTTAYDLYEDPGFDPSTVKTNARERFLAAMMARTNSTENVARVVKDLASYDMHIDNALQLNKDIAVLPDTYYFSQPCVATVRTGNICVPELGKIEPFYSRSSKIMGTYKGTTRGGYPLDESWQDNDGLVNTISSTYPFDNPHAAFNKDDIKKGIWNVFETYRGDHMSLQGGLFKKHDIEPYYRKLLEMITELQ